MLTRRQTTSSTDRLELAYWAARAGAERVLLLVPGGASNHTRWSEFAETTELGRTWTLIAPDMRGNGETMTRGPQHLELWCADLADVLDAERAQAAVVVGHSLGAQIAVHFAHRHPDRTAGLVLIDPLIQHALTGRYRRVRRYRWLVRAAVAVIRALNAIGIYRRHIPNRDLRELDEETRRALRGSESFAEIARRYGALGPILKYEPTANYLRQVIETVRPLPPLAGIEVPVLALLSGGTTLSDLADTRAALQEFPDCETVILEANHWPLTETPDAVREAIEAWVSRRFGEFS